MAAKKAAPAKVTGETAEQRAAEVVKATKAPAKRALNLVPPAAEPAKAAPAKGTGRFRAPSAEAAPAKATPAKKAAKASGWVLSDEEAASRAAKAAATRAAAEASGETQTCAGPCGQTKAITAFPTTAPRKDGTIGRGKVCRACMRAGKA
jgi:hypothetical protein